MNQLQGSKRWQKTIISPSFHEAGNHRKSSITCTLTVRHKTIVSPPLHHSILHHRHHPSPAQQYRCYKMGIFHDYTHTTTHNCLPFLPNHLCDRLLHRQVDLNSLFKILLSVFIKFFQFFLADLLLPNSTYN